jgi:hypothetical protein
LIKDTTQTNAHPLLTSLIDYAGLFPPAQLSLEPAIRNYAAYQLYADSWMLGRFIIPAVRLAELTPYLHLFSKERRLNISAIGQRSTTKEECLNLLNEDLEKITLFCNDNVDVVGINVLEMPLPPIVPDHGFLKTIAAETNKHDLQTFCEVTIPLNEEWENQMLRTLDEIVLHNRKKKGGSLLGVKLRTGGVTADAFPTPEQVALVLVGCSDRDIPQKFTAGLHHPIRMYREEVETKMHGFLNLFTAGLLARSKKLDVATVVEILSDENAENFTFTEHGLYWKSLRIDVSEIEQLRQNALYSYGSCSFDEPREDLRALQFI